MPENLKSRTVGNSACLFPIKRIVYDRKENNLQKMTNIYVGAAVIGANVVLVINHPEAGKDVDIYIGVCGETSRQEAYGKANIFLDNLMGNFPGCQTGHGEEPLTQKEITDLLNDCLNSKKYFSVSSVSGVASLRKDTKRENAAFFQSIEKLIDGMENRAYSAIIIANCISADTIAEMQAEYENLYHMLSPHARLVISLNKSNAETLSKNLSTATSETISKTKSKTLSIGETKSESNSKGRYEGSGDSIGINTNFDGEAELDILIAKASGKVSAGLGGNHSWFRGENWSKVTTVGKTNTTSTAENDTTGNTFSITTSDGKTISMTMGQSHQLTFENKTVQMLMTTINQQIQRLYIGMEQGMFAVSAYFIGSDIQSVNSAASIYKSIINGDNSHIESSAVNLFEKKNAVAVKKYLNILCHPVFQLYENETVTPASIVTAGELAIHMGLPKKSVTGIPVSSSVSFGRSIHRLSPVDTTHSKTKEIRIGKIYHLGMINNTEVNLDFESLSMHTLLCGTTGSGKSNTAYRLLKQLLKTSNESVHFLVIEPAKGEYKDVINNNVSVYGTNFYYTPMLRINPFYFCRKGRKKGVHILEHLDRLTSIFNVCWPMEAAMPVVLKNALERAYISAGWDLTRSVNYSSDFIFPTFEDVLNEVEKIMLESKFSDEVKGNYIGALCTRLKELTDGINGMIFGQNDLTDEQLFDRNVIIDLSRIGSIETKALIMGLLLIRLQEYRQCTVSCANSSMRHLTVIEEAHHLLRSTSTTQSVDGVNLIGRSVEMISNAFAEMRTYGEGFLIVDQSPEQLDKSVIRNTNTKIVMRLPENEDRVLVGKAMGLNEEQLSDLARLPTGIAAVYQNDWLESILVSIPREESGTTFDYEFDIESISSHELEDSLNKVLLSFENGELVSWIKNLGENPSLVIVSLSIPTKIKKSLCDCCRELENGQEHISFKAIYRLVYEFYHAEEAIDSARTLLGEVGSSKKFQEVVINGLKPHPAIMFHTFAFEYHRRTGKLGKLLSILNKGE